MADIWMGDTSYRQAMRDGSFKIMADRVYSQNISAWLSQSMFADLPPAREI